MEKPKRMPRKQKKAFKRKLKCNFQDFQDELKEILEAVKRWVIN
jgi:hypothetical protein